jgi:hypothetical protein
MIGRGVIELFMMYVTKNWHHYLGIAHDLLCAVVLFAAAINLGRVPQFMKYTCLFLCLTLLIEACFAYYMLTQVSSNEPVYYVPNNSQHQLVFNLTWMAVASSIAFIVYFTRKWVHYHLRGRFNW